MAEKKYMVEHMGSLVELGLVMTREKAVEVAERFVKIDPRHPARLLQIEATYRGEFDNVVVREVEE